MTTQADITLAIFNLNQCAATMQADISTLINAIVDQNNITPTSRLPPGIINQLDQAASAIANLVSAIGSAASGSAV